jgi:WD40 repeat protein
MGFQADIIIWDLKTQSLLSRLSLHKVQIASLSFSLDGKYLVSLGGQDDNNVILWDMDTFTALCGHPASPDSSGSTLTVKFHANGFVTGGMNTLRSWVIDRQRRKLIPSECKLGQIKRVVGCLAINGESVYCGTSTGDVLKVDLATGLFKIHGPKVYFLPNLDSVGKWGSSCGD